MNEEDVFKGCWGGGKWKNSRKEKKHFRIESDKNYSKWNLKGDIRKRKSFSLTDNIKKFIFFCFFSFAYFFLKESTTFNFVRFTLTIRITSLGHWTGSSTYWQWIHLRTDCGCCMALSRSCRSLAVVLCCSTIQWIIGITDALRRRCTRGRWQCW